LPAKPEPASSLKRFDIRLRREPSSSTLGEVEVQGVQQFHGGVGRDPRFQKLANAEP